MSIHGRKPLAPVFARTIIAYTCIAAAPGVLAQTERFTVTGSSILRTQVEGALPVLTLDRQYIEQSGATNATELIQQLPQVQNFVAASTGVNGSGQGNTTAALHALPSKYTLVLIDGVRPPPAALNNSFGGGFAAAIQAIPLDAVERVEILLDGATAIYGSDAIAGVVNFILKKNTTEGNAYAQYTWPTKGGAQGVNAGVSKGWGDLVRDGWNVMGTFSYAHQEKLLATDRKVSKQGAYFPFTHNGVNYIFNNATENTEPGNLIFQAVPATNPTAAPTAYSINPYYRQNGNCQVPAVVITDPTGTGPLGAVGESCRFNYAATVQDVPPSDTLNFVGKGYLRLGDNATAWVTVNLSHFETTPQYAPPAQPFGLNTTTRTPILYNTYVQPFLTANNLLIVSPDPTDPDATLANVGYRGKSLGGRADKYETNTQQYVAGVDGSAWGWDYNARISYADAKFTDTAAGGYTDSIGFFNAIDAGLYDPIMGTGGASVAPFILDNKFYTSHSKLSNLHLGAQHNFFELSGGPTILALGLDFFKQKYNVDYGDYYLYGSGFSTQPALASFPIGGAYGQVPLGMERDNWAAYAEWFFPITKTLEATASVRYDHYDKTHSNWVFSTELNPVTGLYDQLADADLGNTFSKTTYKVSARWLPIQTLLVRGSWGTGFRAPAMTDIAGALVFAGSTTGSYACPFPGTPGCRPGSAQYDLLAGPNGLSGDNGLKPETSKQWTAGARWDPFKGLSIGADLWNVEIKNQVLSQGIAEQVGFQNPQQYASLFVNPYADPAGFTTIAFSQLPFNGGTAKYQGIDYDVTYTVPTSWGTFSANLTGTHMIKAKYTFGPGEPFNTDLGKFGPDQQVVFKNTAQLILSLQTGPWMNSLTGHYKSGYEDASYGAGETIFLANPDGSVGESVALSGVRVPSYTTWDWQTVYNFNKDIRGTIGILNMFDRDPPRSLQTGGGGNQVGYDGRYANPIGRAIYGRIGIRF
jgi:iron complex outermembrane receptor protein